MTSTPESILTDTEIGFNIEEIIQGLIVNEEKKHTEEATGIRNDPSYAIDHWPQPHDDLLTEFANELNIPLKCRDCKIDGSPCNLVFCAGCGAPKKPAHRECLRKDPDHRPHGPPGTSDCDEVELKDYIYLTWLFDSGTIKGRKEDEHLQDIWSKWLGVPQDQTEARPTLHIWPRINHLLNSANELLPRQYPSLVSFVGDTGSGKSALIRAMIRLVAPRSYQNYSAPVPGTIQDQFSSTSSDVHLFADPATISKEVPILLADCEGFLGGTTPVSRKIVADANATFNVIQTIGKRLKSPRELIQDHLNNTNRKICLEWGHNHDRCPTPSTTSSMGQSPAQSQHYVVQSDTRDVIVKSLWPRTLYAFSDVVCFVTNNTRSTQDALCNLFDWAKEGFERTINQRVRPGLIIVLNKNCEASDNLLRDVDCATNELLRSFEQSSRFSDFRRKWENRGRTIHSARDLIKCYYHDFRVVSIPLHARAPSTAKSISNQVLTLYCEIRSLSAQIQEHRKLSNMNLDVASFNRYLEQSIRTIALDHQNSLDFHPMSENDTPLPTRPSEHLSLLLRNLVRYRKLDKSTKIGSEAQLIKEMIPYLAASIKAQTPEPTPHNEQKRKEFLVDEACRGFEKFRSQYWRCEATDESGQLRCGNHWESHEKGHQFTGYHQRVADIATEDGPLLRIGEYESSYDAESFRDRLWEQIRRLRDPSEARLALEKIGQDIGISDLTSQRTCLSCLANCPTNMLPCKPNQHAICEKCILQNGQRGVQHSVITLTKCPLGCRFTTLQPWTIRIKPERAGPRILVLDGGGIRGITQLRILTKLAEEVGFEIPIQQLFDLVIGTNAGGIVALGVFEKGWAPKDSIRKFERFAEGAFTKRRSLQVPVVDKIFEPFYTFKYRTSGIEDALREAFGEDYLFGHDDSDASSQGDSTKTGVVSCLDGRNQPCLIANYNRNPRQGGKEDLASGSSNLRCADAYVDGAVVRNNPVRVAQEEARHIWKSSAPLDIVLSVGSGVQIDEHGKRSTEKKPRSESLKKLLPAGVRKMIDTGLDMVTSTLDCQREWEDFLRANESDPRLLHNCHRLDIGLARSPPALDAVGAMHGLSSEAEWYLAPPETAGPGKGYLSDRFRSAHDHVHVVASRLIAALFYFSAELRHEMPAGALRGSICCRLPPHSNGAVNLLASRPRFRLREGDKVSDVVFVTGDRPFDQRTLAAPVRLELAGGRQERSIEVQLVERASYDWTPISGF
ncbi:hypothetical protein F4677DRAFT_446666 [Hypoxylon crocopeplum]|nr:hypothetical protein F4677DRAFT_446666 [Hypoxylon crocopeplum]